MTTDGPASGEPIWQYDSGEWSRTAGPYDWSGDDDGDADAALERAGYYHAEQLGRPRLPIVQLYEHEDGGKWVLACSFNQSRTHSIYVPNLPSLLDVMGQLSPVVTATLLSDVAERLDHLVTLTGADADETFEERTEGGPY